MIPRRTERTPVRLPAQCRTQSGLRDKGYISDISTGGCCITTPSLYLRVGSRVLVRPEGLEGLTGVVRWISGETAGIEFDTAIYEPVVDHLSALHRTGQPVTLNRY